MTGYDIFGLAVPIKTNVDNFYAIKPATGIIYGAVFWLILGVA